MNINEAKLVSFVTFLAKEELNSYNIDRLINLIKDCYSVQVEAERTKVDLKPIFSDFVKQSKD